MVISIYAAISYWNQSGVLSKNQWNWSKLAEVVHTILTLWSLNHKPEVRGISFRMQINKFVNTFIWSSAVDKAKGVLHPTSLKEQKS